MIALLNPSATSGKSEGNKGIQFFEADPSIKKAKEIEDIQYIIWFITGTQKPCKVSMLSTTGWSCHKLWINPDKPNFINMVRDLFLL